MSYFSVVNPHLNEAESKMVQIMQSVSPFIKKKYDDSQNVLASLFLTLHLSSLSIIKLLEIRAVFDAEIILRSILEGTMRYCFLITGSDVERKEKYNEYKVLLTDLHNLQDHYKAIRTIETLKKYSTNSTVPFELSVLDDIEVDRIKQTYTRKRKTELQTKWSFNHLLESLADHNELYGAQLGSSFSYSASSHLLHFDWIGVSQRILASSSSLTEDTDHAIGHALRILSNTMSFLLFRLAEYMQVSETRRKVTAKLALDLYDQISEIDIQLNNIIDVK